MTTLDVAWIDTCGLGSLGEDDKLDLLRVVSEELEHRVGRALTELMNDEQMDAFAEIADSDPDKGLDWLDENVPSRRHVVAREESGIAAELSQRSEEILGILILAAG